MTPPSESSTGRSRSEVVRVDEDIHLPQLAEFVGEVWSPGIVESDLRASRAASALSNPAHPGEAPPTFLFLLDGRAVGHLTTIPTRLQWSDWAGEAHWLKGFWVLPEHRNGPIGAMLVRAAARELDCLLATVVDAAPRRVFGAFKMADLGLFTEHIKLIQPKRVIERLDPKSLGLDSRKALGAGLKVARLPGISDLAGALLRAGFALRSVGGVGARDLKVRVDPPNEDGLDPLWAKIARQKFCSPVRDAAYRSRTYGSGPNTKCRILSMERNGQTVAWAGIRMPRSGEGDPRLGGIRIATLTDIVVPPSRPGDLLALLREAESLAGEDGADALLCSATHPVLRDELSRRAYVSVGGNLHLVARGPKGGPALPASLDDWWLTRADGGADDGL